MSVSPGARLAVAAAALAAWLGWLGYLVATSSRPVVLSQPQFLAADLDVVADVHESGGRPDPRVHVHDVPWTRDGRPPAGDIIVVNLAEAEIEGGWRGSGLYILPLVRSDDRYRVARIPPSPGFDPRTQDARPRIYPGTEETLRQLQGLR